MSGEFWYDMLAIIPYVALSTWSLLVAGSFLFVVRMNISGRYLIWGVAAFTLLAVFFFSLAVTGGSDPLIPRRQLAIPIRLVAIGILLTGYGWIVLWARTHIVIKGHRKAEGAV
jgi:hypothetical protein